MPNANKQNKDTLSKVWIIVTVMMAMMLAALDMTIVGTAMPSIINTLHGLTNYSWVFSAYLLTSTVPVPVFSKLADMYGRKRMFLIGAGIFTIGSLLCGMSGNMPQLIVFRAVQGLGAAGVLPVALTIVGDVFTMEQRAKIQGFFSAVWGISAVVGPLLGAIIVEYFNWRIVFYLNVPIGIIVMIVLVLSFKENFSVTKHRLDWLGTILLSGGVTVLLLALVQNSSNLVSPEAILLLILSFACLIAFAWWERRASEPVLPGVLFQHRLLVVSNGVNLFAGAVMFGLISYLPLYVQGVEGGSPTLAGRAITPMLIGWPIAALVVGPILLRIGFRIIGIIGGLFIAGGSAILAIATNTGQLTIDGALFLIGVGLGLSLTGLLIVCQGAVPWNIRGAVTGSSQFFRTIGGSIGVALMGAILNHQLTKAASSTGSDSSSSITGALLYTKERDSLSASMRNEFVHILSNALHDVFVVGFALSIALVLLVLWIPTDRSKKSTLVGNVSEMSS
ncbi:MFS transporter [Alicyclobacillus tolerans]|uniref:MDR family MFS transporter n=1 Tax=Alicyclobacillus tolerans TaxID=90970 RepID=UPI001F421C87|nr:MDR family MFS transporter [Alicyclobacillus tolerans]MCF8567397.1 MFS transporter [Alicyclobacillus tolerans]